MLLFPSRPFHIRVKSEIQWVGTAKAALSWTSVAKGRCSPSGSSECSGDHILKNSYSMK